MIGNEVSSLNQHTVFGGLSWYATCRSTTANIYNFHPIFWIIQLLRRLLLRQVHDYKSDIELIVTRKRNQVAWKSATIWRNVGVALEHSQSRGISFGHNNFFKITAHHTSNKTLGANLSFFSHPNNKSADVNLTTIGLLCLWNSTVKKRNDKFAPWQQEYALSVCYRKQHRLSIKTCPWPVHANFRDRLSFAAQPVITVGSNKT